MKQSSGLVETGEMLPHLDRSESGRDSKRPAGTPQQDPDGPTINLQEDDTNAGRATVSVRVLSEVWDKSEASGTTLLVLLALADHANDEGVCFPFVTSLASKGRCDEKTVRRAIRALQETKEVDVWEWYDKRSGRKRNCYRVVVGGFAALRGTEPEDIRERATILRISVPTARRRAIFERDHWTCVTCGSKTDLCIDHIVPVDEGGDNDEENLQTLCALCNAKKSNSFAGESRPGEMSGRNAPKSSEMSTPDRTPVSASHAGASSLLEPSVGTVSTPSAELTLVAPKLTKIDGRDVPFDTLAEVCGLRQGSPRMRLVGIALNGARGKPEDGIRAQFARDVPPAEWDDPAAWERQLAIDIRARALLYRQKMPGAALTPNALAQWWTDLPGLPDPGRGDGRVTAAEAFAEAQELQRQGR